MAVANRQDDRSGIIAQMERSTAETVENSAMKSSDK
jgi:hypothetical protein